MKTLTQMLATVALVLGTALASAPVEASTRCTPANAQNNWQGVCRPDDTIRGYDGKDGPVQLADVYWMGPSGSGNMCWFERDTMGRLVQRRCGKVPARVCGQSAQLCNPMDNQLCVHDRPLGASMNLYNLKCEKFDTPQYYAVDLAKVFKENAFQPGTTFAMGDFRCTYGQTCDPVVVEGRLVDVILRVDTALAKGSPLRMGQQTCQHLVDCQRMLTGDVFPFGNASVFQVMEDRDRVANPQKYTQPPLWNKMPGLARAIGAGADGSIWVIGAKEIGPGGNEIYRWVADQWTLVAGAARRIAVDGMGRAWVATKNNQVYRWNGGSWDGLPGAFVDVAVNARGQAWALSTKWRPGGQEVHRWSGTGWTLIGGGMVRLAVDSAGNAWGVTEQGGIYRWIGHDWQQLPGAAVDIGIGGDDSVFVAGRDGNVHKWAGSGWVKRDGQTFTRDGQTFTAIAVDGKGVPYALLPSGEIFRGTP